MLLAASCLMPILVMALRRRSVARGIWSVVAWHVQGFGLVRGFLRPRKSPTEAICSRIIRTAVPQGCHA
jgi:hypothetical protein